jgi:hypothetical protein
MGMLYITNRNPEAHTDRFDGVDYVFPPGQKVVLSQEAATHMFGVGLADKTDTLVRLGKGSRYDPATRSFKEHPDDVRWLANFVVTRAMMVEESQALPVIPRAGPQELEIA